jgi:hypothetical protein
MAYQFVVMRIQSDFTIWRFTTLFLLAISFTIITTTVIAKSLYHDMLSPSIIPVVAPNVSLVILQGMVTATVLLVRECFLMACATCRFYLLYHDKTSLLSFVGLSNTTGLGLLARCLITRSSCRPGCRPANWRLVALFRLTISLLLVASHLVWLGGLDIAIVYQKLHSSQLWLPRVGFGTGVGPFKPTQGLPLPFSMLRDYNFLTDKSQVWEVEPAYCTNEDLHCAAYTLIGESSLLVANPDRLKGQAQNAVILEDVPSYVVEYHSGDIVVGMDDSAEPWTYCQEHTSKMGSYLKMCMRGIDTAPDGTASQIQAAWRWCLSVNNCTEIVNRGGYEEKYNSTSAQTIITIQKQNVTLALSDRNGNILDLDLKGRTGITNYSISVADFFAAWTERLNPIAFNITKLLQIDYLKSPAAVQAFYPIYLNTTDNSTTIALADYWVDGLVFAFTTPLPSENPAVHLRASLSYSLVQNSGLFYDIISGTEARPRYVLRVNVWSLWIFFGFNIFILVLSLSMVLFFVPKSREKDKLIPEFGLDVGIPPDDEELARELLMGYGGFWTALHTVCRVRLISKKT